MKSTHIYHFDRNLLRVGEASGLTACEDRFTIGACDTNESSDKPKSAEKVKQPNSSIALTLDRGKQLR